MLTKEQEKFFVNYFKELFYQTDKRTIEDIFKKIENDEEREKRDKLLKKAEKKAAKNAKKAVAKIKNLDLNELTDPNNSKVAEFANKLLNDIDNDIS